MWHIFQFLTASVLIDGGVAPIDGGVAPIKAGAIDAAGTLLQRLAAPALRGGSARSGGY